MSDITPVVVVVVVVIAAVLRAAAASRKTKYGAMAMGALALGHS